MHKHTENLSEENLSEYWNTGSKYQAQKINTL